MELGEDSDVLAVVLVVVAMVDQEPYGLEDSSERS